MGLLARTPVGRVALSVGALPVILPVYCALYRDAMLLRTVPGAGTDPAAPFDPVGEAVVAFQADAFTAEGAADWSVLVQGVARRLSRDEGSSVSASLDVDWWTLTPDPEVVRIELGRVSGSRFATARPGRAR